MAIPRVLQSGSVEEFSRSFASLCLLEQYFLRRRERDPRAARPRFQELVFALRGLGQLSYSSRRRKEKLYPVSFFPASKLMIPLLELIELQGRHVVNICVRTCRNHSLFD